MESGWIKLYRSSFNNKLYFSDPFTRWQAWTDLILLANHKDGVIRKRGVKVIVERGQLGHSERTLAKRWKWSRGKVRRFLDELKMEQQVIPQKTNVTTLLTIVNYNEYQDTEPQAVPQTGHKQYLNNKGNNKLLVKQSENEKKVFGNVVSGQALFAERYKDGRPSSYFRPKDDFEGKD